MVRKTVIASIITTMLLLSGCGDSEGENRLAIDQMLNDGNYAGVISALEGSANSSEEYIALGAAYMGKAGVSLTNIVSAMASDNNTTADGFSGFVNSIAEISTPTAIVDLGKSAENYKMVVGDCTNTDLSDAAKDICLYIGLGATTRTAVTIENLVGDVSSFGDDTIIDNQLTASICAMQYAFDGGDDTNIDGSCTVTPDLNVTFESLNKTYEKFTVDVNGTDYYYLMTNINGTQNKQTVLTDGYCTDNDFSTRTDDYNSTVVPALHACPINEDPIADELTTAGVLVDVLNDGMESIGAAVTEDIQQDIDEFKCEILGSTYNGYDNCTDTDISQDISEQNIIDYLESQN